MANELLDKLNEMLRATISKRLKEEGKVVCAQELSDIRGVLNFAEKAESASQTLFRRNHSAYKDVLATLRRVMQQINAEGARLEKEMQGLNNVTPYELDLVNRFRHKVILRQTLQDMTQEIARRNTHDNNTPLSRLRERGRG